MRPSPEPPHSPPLKRCLATTSFTTTTAAPRSPSCKPLAPTTTPGSGPSGFNLSGGPTGDDDGDGLTNFEEYAFGLNPTTGSSVNPITSQLDKSSGLFTYSRRNPALITGVTYSYEYSTTLSGAWNPIVGATESSNSGSPTELITVDVPDALLTANAKLFVRVKAVK